MSSTRPAHNQLISPQKALARIPGWDKTYSCEKLGGGLTNRSWLLRSDAGTFVLRLDAVHTATFGLDRTTESRVLQKASEAGIGPRVVFSDPEAGILLYRYLEGPVWQPSSLSESRNLERLADLLREVHALPASGVLLNALSVASSLGATAEKEPAFRQFAGQCLSIVAGFPAPSRACCCHNDVIAANVVEGDRLRLLDWEYACDNDPYFDLASVIAYHDLDNLRLNRLLDAYTGGRNSEAKELLDLQLRLFDCLQWLWLAAREVVTPHPGQRARLVQLRHRIH